MSLLLLFRSGGAPPTNIARVWNGSMWVTPAVKVWTGASWVAARAKVWTGTEWKG